MFFSCKSIRSAILIAGFLPGLVFGADNIVAVLSSDLRPYQEALASFQEAFGRSVATVILSKSEVHISPSTKIIVAFGGKAATHKYPAGTTLIYTMCPGILVGPDQHDGPSVKIYMAPPAKIMVSRMKEICPDMKRIAIFWTSPGMGAYNHEFQVPAELNGIEVVSIKLERLEDLPDRLRALDKTRVALWMPPDPLVVTPNSFSTLKEFARANKIPFFAPTSTLVKAGATASITVSYRVLGNTASDVVKKVLAGETVPQTIFPEKITVSVNKSALESAGQHLSDGVLRKMDEVYP